MAIYEGSSSKLALRKGELEEIQKVSSDGDSNLPNFLYGLQKTQLKLNITYVYMRKLSNFLGMMKKEILEF